MAASHLTAIVSVCQQGNSCMKSHVVEAGDTCYDIASHNGISLVTLQALNGLNDNSCGSLQVSNCFNLLNNSVKMRKKMIDWPIVVHSSG